MPISIFNNSLCICIPSIICVSGDGLYQELLEGYLKQLQKAHGVDIHDPRAKLVKPSIPFCLMPAGLHDYSNCRLKTFFFSLNYATKK